MNKIALVTGASSGLGRATAELLVTQGYEVFGTTRSTKPTDIGRVRMLTLELADERSIEACVGAVVERSGRIDLLVNNAGRSMAGAIEEVSLEELQHEFQVNFFGTLRVIKRAMPTLRAQGSGRIVNVSSAAATVPVPFYGVYGASKAALERVTFSLRQELRPFGIHVSVVSPSSHRTNMQSTLPAAPIAAYQVPRDRIISAARQAVADGGDPVDVARTILLAATARHPKARYPVGKDAKAFAFIQRLVSHAFIERMIGAKFKLGTAALSAPAGPRQLPTPRN